LKEIAVNPLNFTMKIREKKLEKFLKKKQQRDNKNWKKKLLENMRRRKS
jgi:hypothetical protein